MLSGMCHMEGWDRYRLGHPAVEVLAEALGLMYSQATVRSYTRDRAVLRWDHTLKGGGYKVDKKPRPKYLMWEPSQATSDKDINGLVLASAGCRLFGERRHRETVYVLCGGKGTAPGCALHGSPKVPSVILERPLNSQAHLQSSLNQEVLRTWLAPPCEHHFQAFQTTLEGGGLWLV